MTFAFATLAFLVAAWLAVVVLAATLEDYGRRVLAALSGRPPATIQVASISGRVRPRYPTARPVRLRAQPQWRAAA